MISESVSLSTGPIVSRLTGQDQVPLQVSAYADTVGKDISTLAGRIAYAVEQSGKSLERLAQEAGCSHVAISNWQTGKTGEIKASLLLAFADATGFESRWLLTGAGPVQSRYHLTATMDRLVDAAAKLAREEPLQLETVVRMVEAAAAKSTH